MLNCCLCIDLILTIQSPFTPAGSRSKFYYGVSTIVPLVMVIIIHITRQQTETNDTCKSCLNLYDSSSRSTVVRGTMITGIGNYILSFVMSVYILVAIYSVIYAYRRLERPGVSKEVRSMFLKKHSVYVFVFIGIWTIQLSQNYYQLFNPPNPATTGEQRSIYDYRVTALDTLSAKLGFRGPA